MSDTNLNQSKIININDFIFKQNLEFYPNLHGLSCEDNQIIYRKNNEIVTTEPLTFDLRTLPGDAWNTTPEEFIDIIRLNKECKNLYRFINLMQKYGNTSFIKPDFAESEA